MIHSIVTAFFYDVTIAKGFPINFFILFSQNHPLRVDFFAVNDQRVEIHSG